MENQIKVINRSSFNNPFGKRNVINFLIYCNTAPEMQKHGFHTIKGLFTEKAVFHVSWGQIAIHWKTDHIAFTKWVIERRSVSNFYLIFHF